MALALLVACRGQPAVVEDTPPVVEDAPIVPLCEPVSGTNITVRHVASTAGAATLVTSPPNDTRDFVVELDGRIKILENGVLQETPFLDISLDAGGPVHRGGNEQGLLGLAFHPDFANNGTFYVYYTPRLKNRVARYQVDPADPSRADPASEVVILDIADAVDTHNGGMIAFGPDGLLYIGTGDGGRANDPDGNGQNPNVLLGKMLRIDVDRRDPGKEYAIPPQNPFATGGGAPEILMIGLRNPWRWSFDRATGDLWIGDVGQNNVEELTVIPAGTTPLNLGWNMFEGTSCFSPPCDSNGKTMPGFEIRHNTGWCSVIGGVVYRGECYPDLAGTYLFTDFCRGALQVATLDAAGIPIVTEVATTMIDFDGTVSTGFPARPSSLHTGSRGDLFLTTTTCCGGTIYGGVWRLEAGP